MFGYTVAGFGGGNKMSDTITKVVNANMRGCVGDGVTDNTGPLMRMREFMLRNPNKLYRIYFEPGKYVYINNRWLAGVNKFILDAYGCTFQCIKDSTWNSAGAPILMNDIFNDIGDPVGVPVWITGNKFNTASPGDLTINMVDSGAASDYIAGERVLVYGYDQQFYGIPPNARYFEFKIIESIGHGTVTFTEPLLHYYDKRWPDDKSRSNPPFGAPRIVTLDTPHRNNLIADFIHIRGASFLGNSIRPNQDYVQTPGWEVIYEDATFRQLPIAMIKKVTLIRGSVRWGTEYDKVVESCSSNDCEFWQKPGGVAIGGGTGVHKLTFNRVTFRGNIKLSPRYLGITDCDCHAAVDARYGILALAGNHPMRVLKVEGTSFYNTAPDTLLHAINTFPPVSLTVDSVQGTNIILIWNTEAEFAAKQIDYGKTITKSDGTDTGVVTEIYHDGGDPGNLVIEGTWNNPTPGDVYEWEVIDSKYDGGGNHIVGEQVPMWRYPAAVNS